MSRSETTLLVLVFAVAALLSVGLADAADYEVGPEIGTLANIGDVPSESLVAGDRVFILRRSASYRER